MKKWKAWCINENYASWLITLPFLYLFFLPFLSLSLPFGNKDKISRQRKRKERTYTLLRIQGRRKSQMKFVVPKSLDFCWDKNQWQQLAAASQRIQRSAKSLGIQIFLNKTFWSEVLRVKGVMTSFWRCLFYLTPSFPPYFSFFLSPFCPSLSYSWQTLYNVKITWVMSDSDEWGTSLILIIICGGGLVAK